MKHDFDITADPKVSLLGLIWRPRDMVMRSSVRYQVCECKVLVPNSKNFFCTLLKRDETGLQVGEHNAGGNIINLSFLLPMEIGELVLQQGKFEGVYGF